MENVNININTTAYYMQDAYIEKFKLKKLESGETFVYSSFFVNIPSTSKYDDVCAIANKYGKCKVFQVNMWRFIIDYGHSIATLSFGGNPEITIVGNVQLISSIEIDYRTEREDKAEIAWYYMVNGKLNNKTFELVPNSKPIKDAFYPYIRKGVDTFIDEYFKSSSPVLLLMGPPGTGKTSFLRHLIAKNFKKTMVTFDEEVMQSDEYFANFIESDYFNLMAIEDADILISSRQKHGNKVMGKILNASDGLIQLNTKKMIFTTNIDTISAIDPALIRPGRCFDVIQFRQLSATETNKVRDICEVSNIPQSNNKEYTLSEIFMGKHEEQPNNQLKGFGFL